MKFSKLACKEEKKTRTLIPGTCNCLLRSMVPDTIMIYFLNFDFIVSCAVQSATMSMDKSGT